MSIHYPPQYRYSLYTEWDKEAFSLLSKIGKSKKYPQVLGKFSLPSATVLFEREGKIKESISNRAFFVSEQQVGEVEEEW